MPFETRKKHKKFTNFVKTSCMHALCTYQSRIFQTLVECYNFWENSRQFCPKNEILIDLSYSLKRDQWFLILIFVGKLLIANANLNHCDNTLNCWHNTAFTIATIQRGWENFTGILIQTIQTAKFHLKRITSRNKYPKMKPMYNWQQNVLWF